MASTSTSTTSTTSTLSESEALVVEFSDTYKDIHGFRPRGFAMDRFRSWAPEMQRRELGYLQDRLEALLEYEARRGAEVEAFRAKVEALGLDPDRYMDLA